MTWRSSSLPHTVNCVTSLQVYHNSPEHNYQLLFPDQALFLFYLFIKALQHKC